MVWHIKEANIYQRFVEKFNSDSKERLLKEKYIDYFIYRNGPDELTFHGGYFA